MAAQYRFEVGQTYRIENISWTIYYRVTRRTAKSIFFEDDYGTWRHRASVQVLQAATSDYSTEFVEFNEHGYGLSMSANNVA